MLSGLLLPSALSATVAPTRAARRQHFSRSLVARSAPVAAQKSFHFHARGSGYHPAAVGKLPAAHLRIAAERLFATPLVDPVPAGRFAMPAALKGSHDSLLRQNIRSQEDGLERIKDDAALLAMRRNGDLVALPASPALAVDERLPANRRYCRSWTAQFLSDLSRVHYGRFHRQLQVNSAVRTVEYQRHLGLVNGNAAPAEGEDASPHLTGATVDIAKKGLSMDEIGWMRAYLMPLQAAGKVDVEEEFYQACFHITVYRSYQATPSVSEASAKGTHHAHESGGATLLAAGVR